MPDPLIVRAICDSSSGYGQMVDALGVELGRLGVDCRFSPIYQDESKLPLAGWTRERLIEAKPDAPCLVMGAPWTEFPPDSVVFTMWEATRIPAKYVPGMNTARCLIVPCEAVYRWFRDSGVKVPIRIVPLGIHPEIYHPPASARSYRAGVRFGCSGRTMRKGMWPVMVAFLSAFSPDDQSVSLDVKVYGDCVTPTPDDPRIRFIREPYSDRQMADWYGSLHCFVSAARGEGWGLQPHQAMACGTPCIAPFWGGHTGYMKGSSCFPVDYSERAADGVYEADGARWCQVHHGDLVAQMIQAALSPETLRHMGRLAAHRAREFTWERSGRELLGVLGEFGMIA